MSSNINPLNINGAYPVAGQDNDSQGFRDNFTNIRTNLTFAKSEIDDLQVKSVLLAPLNGQTTVNNIFPSTTTMSAAKTSGFTKSVTDLGLKSGATTISFQTADFQKIETSGPLTLTLQDWPSDTYATTRLWISITDPSHTITFPLAVSVGINDILGVLNSVLYPPEAADYIFDVTSMDGGVTYSISLVVGPSADVQGVTILLNGIASNLSAISSNVTTLQGNVASLKASDVTLTSAITTLQTNDITLVSGLANVVSNVTTLQSESATSTPILSNIVANVSDIQSNVTILQGNVSTLTSGLGNVVANVSTLQSTVSNITSVGTLGSLTVAGSILAGSVITANAQITGGSISTRVKEYPYTSTDINATVSYDYASLPSEFQIQNLASSTSITITGWIPNTLSHADIYIYVPDTTPTITVVGSISGTITPAASGLYKLNVEHESDNTLSTTFTTAAVKFDFSQYSFYNVMTSTSFVADFVNFPGPDLHSSMRVLVDFASTSNTMTFSNNVSIVGSVPGLALQKFTPPTVGKHLFEISSVGQGNSVLMLRKLM